MSFVDSLIAMKDGGVWMMPVLLLTGINVLATLGLGVVLALGKRVPSAVLLLAPVLLLLVGLAGQGMGMRELALALTMAPPEMHGALQAGGTAISLYPMLGAVMPLPMVLGGLCLFAGIGAVSHKLDAPRWTPLHLIGPVLLLLVAAALLLVVPTFSLGVVMVAVGVVLASLRSSHDPGERAWLAGARGRVLLLACLSMLTLAWSSMLWGQMEVLNAVATAPPDLRQMLMARGGQQVVMGFLFGGAAAAITLFAGLTSLLLMVRDMFGRRNLLGAGLALVAVAGLLLGLGISQSLIGGVQVPVSQSGAP